MEPGRVGRPGLSVQCPVVEGTTSVPAPVTTPALATEEISVLVYTLRKRCATHTPVMVRHTHITPNTTPTHPSESQASLSFTSGRSLPLINTLQLVYHDNYLLINTVPINTLLCRSREGCDGVPGLSAAFLLQPQCQPCGGADRWCAFWPNIV